MPTETSFLFGKLTQRIAFAGIYWTKEDSTQFKDIEL